MAALTKEPIKIKRPAENDGAGERPNKCAEPSISRLVADNDAEPSTSYNALPFVWIEHRSPYRSPKEERPCSQK